MNISDFYEWFMALGEPYGVNPIIFGSIYVGAIPIFRVAIAWLVNNIRKKKSIVAPVLTACGCAVSAYVYLLIAGNIEAAAPGADLVLGSNKEVQTVGEQEQ